MDIRDFFIGNYQWIIPLIIGGILVPFIILYLQKIAKNKPTNKPDVFISEACDRHYFNIEITNTGTEDIIKFQGTIFWQKDNKEEKRELNAFIDEKEDQLWAHPKECRILRKGERKIAVNIPHYSDNGNIKVAIKGTGLESKKTLDKEFVVKNKIKGQ